MAKKAYVDLEWAEYQASILRGDLELGALEILDPYELASEMELFELLPLDAIQNISPTYLEQLCERDSKGWSAGSLALSDGRVVVIMNPKHAKTRARATLMEEIAHIHLAHEPTLLEIGANNIAARTYNDQQEKEAYWVGAAALVPIAQLRIGQQLRKSVSDMAVYCEVSSDLVSFRCNITGISLSKN